MVKSYEGHTVFKRMSFRQERGHRKAWFREGRKLLYKSVTGCMSQIKRQLSAEGKCIP